MGLSVPALTPHWSVRLLDMDQVFPLLLGALVPTTTLGIEMVTDRPAQLVEHVTLDVRVASLNPALGADIT